MWEGAMHRTRALTTVVMVVAGAVVWRAAVSAENPASVPPPHTGPFSQPFDQAFDQHSVWRTWKIYCDTCHFGPKAKANLNLEALDLANLDDQGAVWEKLLRKLRNREMPPAGMPRP